MLSGRVVKDGQGIPNNPVALHRITPEASAEIASGVTDDQGFFQFPAPRVEGAAFTVYFATADYESVRFFGPPLHADSATNVEYAVAVYDTTSVLPEPLRVASRDIVLIDDLTGGFEVLEVLSVLNPTNFAFVASADRPPWDFRLPEGATDFQVGEGDVLPHELSWMDGKVLQITPVTPGAHQVFISYRLPPGPARSSLLIEEPTDTLNIFVRQPSHLTSLSGLQSNRMVTTEGESFLQYGAVGVAPGTTIGFQWGRLEGLPIDPVTASVIVTLIFLFVGVYAALSNRRRLA